MEQNILINTIHLAQGYQQVAVDDKDRFFVFDLVDLVIFFMHALCHIVNFLIYWVGVNAKFTYLQYDVM